MKFGAVFMQLRFLLVAMCVWATSGLNSHAEFPLAYIGDPDARDLSLSPDGQQIAVLMTDFEFGIRQRRDWDVIEFRSAQTGKVTYKHDLEERVYYWVLWPFDDVLLAQTLKYSFSRGDTKTQLAITAINPTTSEELDLYIGPKGSWDKARDVPKISRISLERREIAIEIAGKRGTELRAVNVDTGASRTLDQGNPNTVRWELNGDLEPILRFDRGKRDNEERVYSKDSNGNWVLMQSFNVFENNFRPAGNVSTDNTMLVLHRPENAERSGLYVYDLSSNDYGDVAFENDTFDLTTVKRTKYGGKLLYVGWFADRLEREWFDDETEAIATMLEKALQPDDSWSILETSQSNKQWLLYVSSPRRPGSYMHFDMETKKLRTIAKTNPSLDEDALAPIKRIDYEAGDGLQLFGYFTTLTDNPSAPLIVMPHGGPVARDYATYDGFAQFLASKGYQVFQPQFRGGGGLGRTFEESGFGEWGKLMQTDIEDGVAKLIEDGLLAENAYRSIMGFSYGGYATLAGATLTPDKYMCAISINGVGDLPMMLASYDRNDPLDREAYDVWVKRIGDPETDMARIKSVSPRHNIDKLKAQVLLIHGDQDDIVNVQQSRAMYDTILAADKYAMYNEIEGAGHQLYNQTDRTDVLVLVDRFLRRCMPAK